MQSRDDHAFESSFWELYLHEAYRRSGYHITVHPDVSGSSKHPDFLLENNDGRFYLEAVRANIAAGTLAEARRLNDVHAVLESLAADKFIVRFAHDSIGPRPLATTNLRGQLMQWLASLDPQAIANEYTANPSYRALPRYPFKADGWHLEFTAVPLRSEVFGRGGRLVGMFGAVRAAGVDNVTPLTRVFDEKANRYGALDAPLVIAAMANTEYPTRAYEIQNALYGLSALPPRQASNTPTALRDVAVSWGWTETATA